ncbi:MAG: hypothetical protein EZS28_046803, partial [Streblomastix strix]
MTIFEPITANITIGIEALEQLHIDWKETQTQTEFVTLKVNNEFEISTQEPWVIRRKEDGFIPKFSYTNNGYLQAAFGGQKYNLHRQVADQYVANDDPITKTLIEHKNGVKTDNSIGNLRWTETQTQFITLKSHNNQGYRRPMFIEL